LAELKSGRADLALVILPPAEMGLLDAFETRPLGYQRLMVAVPALCPIEQVNFEQLAAIFGLADGPRAPTRWSDLGIGGEWGTRPPANWNGSTSSPCPPSPAANYCAACSQKKNR